MTSFRMLRALRIHNFRLFFAGQAISVVGNWIQKVGQAWIILEMTDSGVMLGVVAAVQSAPTLILSPWGGLIADRHNKRRILVCMSAVAMTTAFLLGIATMAGNLEVWMIFLFALIIGITDAIEKPTRQAFIVEMVGIHETHSATTLSTVVQQSGKTFGPAVAGLSLALLGLSASFFLNAGSFAVVILMLLLMRSAEIEMSGVVETERRQLREGFTYVRQSRYLLIPLVLMCIVGTFAFEWIVTIPLVATEVFGGGPDTIAVLFSCLGAGSIAGGLLIGTAFRAEVRSLSWLIATFGFCIILTSFAPTLLAFSAGLVLAGGSSLIAKSVATSHLQVSSRPELRGRVMAILVVTLGGTTTFGAPLIGWIGEAFGARAALLVGGCAAVLAGSLGLVMVQRYAATDRPTRAVGEPA